MIITRKVLSILLIVGLIGCDIYPVQNLNVCQDSRYPSYSQDITLEDSSLIKRLNGKFVRVEGILSYGFEDVAIYPLSGSTISKALWLNTLDNVIADSTLTSLNNEHVVLVGKVNTSRKGHFSMYLATLDSVYCIKEVK